MHMADLDSVLTDLREHREQLARDLARIDAAIAALTGEADGDGSSSAPITERIIELFESRPGQRFTAESALETLRTEGWVSPATDPVNAMRTALSRLARKGTIKRVDRGEYIYPKPEDPWGTRKDPWANPVQRDDPPWVSSTTDEAPF